MGFWIVLTVFVFLWIVVKVIQHKIVKGDEDVWKERV